MRPIVWCAIGLCAGLYLFFNGFRLLQHRRRPRFLDTPVSTILERIHVGWSNSVASPPDHTLSSRPSPSALATTSAPSSGSGNGRAAQQPVGPAGSRGAHAKSYNIFSTTTLAKVMIDPRGADLDLHRDFQEQFCDSFFTTKEEVPLNDAYAAPTPWHQHKQ